MVGGEGEDHHGSALVNIVHEQGAPMGDTQVGVLEHAQTPHPVNT